ncbi:MAG: copper chaperone PCu(A)C [Alsobacter sp.]
MTIPFLARAALLAPLLTFAAIPSQAHEYKAGSLEIVHPWARATPGGAKVGGGYVKVTNHGAEADRLVGGSFDRSERVEIHEMGMKDGIMTMRPVAGGLEIKPGETVELKPGGYHIMFLNLSSPLKQGDKVPATLQFEKAGAVKVEFSVAPLGATSDSDASHGHTAPKTN